MSTRSSVGIRLVGLLVPAVFAASMVVPEQGSLPLGIPEALGCSGSGSGAAVAPPQSGWYSLAASQAAGPGSTISVASDGFVLLEGSYVGLSEEGALASIEFVVTNEAGQEIPGTVTHLGTSPGRFGWSTKEALVVGTHLKASLRVAPATNPGFADGTYTLDVVGPPVELPTPAAQFEGWTNVYTGTGDYVACGPATGSGCSPQIPTASTAYDATGAYVSLTWNVTPPSGVAWEVTSTYVARPGEVAFPSRVLVSGPKNAQASFGSVPFALDAKQACATLTVTDLRTGKQVTADVCHDVEADRTSIIDELAQCTAPPTEALRSQWCAARTAQGLDCATPPGPSDGTPSDGTPSDGTPSDGTPSDGTPNNGTPNDTTPTNTATNDSPHESSGCQLTRRNSSGATAAALALAALGFAVMRRRTSKQATRGV